MRIVMQRTTGASVDAPSIGWHREIGAGLVVLVGVADSDGDAEVAWVAKKIASMRIFSDDADKMNLSIKDVGGEVLSVSQFTLFANIRKGNRPSFVSSGEPTHAKAVWEQLNQELATTYGLSVKTGVFATDMKVSLVNDGPVTIAFDTETMMPTRK